MPPERCQPSVAAVPIVSRGKGTTAAPASCHRPRVAPATTLKSRSFPTSRRDAVGYVMLAGGGADFINDLLFAAS